MTYNEWESNLKARGNDVIVVDESYSGKTVVFVRMSAYNGYYVGWDFTNNTHTILGNILEAKQWIST